jgi:DNA-binding NtrC family response regulator
MAKILVIEDDRGIRNLLEALLTHKGYRVLLAENGEKGFELLRQACPDVIVLDLKMPEMDGLTVLRHIRSLNLTQPVIIYSGAWTPKTEEHVRALGITETITKDCSWEDLEEAVKRALKSLEPGEEGMLPASTN